MKRLLLCLALLTAGAAYSQPYAVMGASSADGAGRPHAALGYRLGPIDVEASRLAVPEASGYGLAVLGEVPVGGAWSTIGKLGVYWLKAADVGGSIDGAAPLAGPPARHETHAAIGIGLAYQLTGSMQLRTLLEHVDGDVLDRERVFTAGLVVRFP